MKLKISLEQDWVKAQLKKDVRVVRSLEKWARAVPGVKLVTSRGNTLVFSLEEAKRPDFAKALEGELGTTYGAEAPASLVTYSVEEGCKDDLVKAKEEEPAASEPEEAPEEEVQAETEEPPKVEKPALDPAAVLDELLASVPARDSKAITEHLRQTHALIPMMKQMKVMSSFWNQHILIAIDEGYGLSEFAKSLGRLYEAHGLVPGGMKDDAVEELKVSVGERHHEYDDWDRALRNARSIAQENDVHEGSHVVLCLDLSEWQGKLDTLEVKKYLRKLSAQCGSFTCVFRVPFVDGRALASIERGLKSLFNVKSLVVPPASLGNLTNYARASLSKQGFAFSDEAQGPFEQWLLDEKRDKSFFGYRTVDKMVNSLVYNKALSNCRAEKTDFTVAPADVLQQFSAGNEEGNPKTELDGLIGLEKVKAKIAEIIAQIKVQRALAEKGHYVERPAIHMLFTGNPGTGKTTVARLVAKLLRQEGILRKGNLVEVKGRDLCGAYVGQTAPKTSAICRDAYGSVLFIDEAYSLFREDSSGHDYGREALDTLVAEMENHRDDLCVILAGYTDEMETMLTGNSGLKSRIPFTVDFPNYSREELARIFFKMTANSFTYEKPLKKAVKDYLDSLSDEVIASKEFANARFVRNLYERTWGKAAVRSQMNEGEIKLLVSDLERATAENEFKQLLDKSAHKPIGFGAGLKAN